MNMPAEHADTRGHAMTTGARLLATLRDDGAHLHVWHEGHIIYRSDAKGLAPLLDALETLPQPLLRDAHIADRVLGKAAALLLVKARAGFVAAVVASEQAVAVLERAGIPMHAETRTPRIEGRTPGEPCPFEAAVATIESPDEAHQRLTQLAGALRGR
jgi:hypothetical protein